ncbi:hypothetical protein BH11MYX1_BH11MYX1_11870 [soil metagenome]
MRGLLVAVSLVVGCGDNLTGAAAPLAHTHDLDVVAHQDDDLLFMQPDVSEAIRGGGGVTTLYITAGNGTRGAGAANPRYQGLKAAYGAAASDQAWACGWLTVREHPIQHCRLEAENISLLFLAYPDGGKQGELHHSLLRLWEGAIRDATTVADRTTVYTRDELIETVAAIMRTVQPDTVRTLDLAASHGYDHSDHMIVGALTALALARTGLDPELLTYRGYNISSEPANKLPALFASAHAVLAHYEACATNCGAACGMPCTKIDPSHDVWLARRYAVGFRRHARGTLRTSSRCLTGGALGDCATAPGLTLARGQLVSDRGCLAIGETGAVGFASCDVRDPAQRFFFDDEAHLWSGAAPDFEPLLDGTHLRCVVPDADGSVTSAACGGADAPRWQWSPRFAFTSRATLGALSATGRAVRIGDLDGDGRGDLCAVTGDGLVCAPGRGDGTFATAIRIDDPEAPLAIDPQSLALGDLDRDGLTDACGRDDAGVLCALSSRRFAATRFASAFADGDARAATSSSITITDAGGDGTAEVCGIAAEGVVCTAGAPFDHRELRSAWPALGASVLPRDLDGDHHADWCALTETGPSCGLAAESSLSTDGVPWGFASNNVVETVTSDPDLAEIADIDGDGDGDLCSLPGNGTIACARSNGHGFGPRTPVAVLPEGAQPTALWLGDLDGDGAADACIDLGDAIACATL